MNDLGGWMNTVNGSSEPVSDHVGRAAVLRRLELDVVRRLDGRVTGEHHTTDYGPGSERAGAREYQPGDDARLIDWNLTARSHVTHVRVTEADRELETWVVADRSGSLDFGTQLREKRDVVLGTAAAFGVLTARAGNRFGVLTCGGTRLHSRPAATGRRAMLGALATLYDTPRAEGPPHAGADLAAALAALRQVQPRRGQVVVVSDFLDSSHWRRSLRQLALRQQVIAVHVTDPRELELPSIGMLGVVDPESGRTVHVHTGSARLRQRYAEAARRRHDTIVSAIHASGAEYLHVSTDRDWLTDVVAFATGRRRPRAVGVRR